MMNLDAVSLIYKHADNINIWTQMDIKIRNNLYNTETKKQHETNSLSHGKPKQFVIKWCNYVLICINRMFKVVAVKCHQTRVNGNSTKVINFPQ